MAFLKRPLPVARTAVAAACCALALAAPASGQPELRTGLLDALRGREPAARAAAADRLAGRESDPAVWATLLEQSLPREVADAGRRRRSWELWDGEQVVGTEVWSYVPESLAPERSAPLILATHGTGGSGEHMVAMWREVAERLGAIVVAPNEPGENTGYRFSAAERTLHLEALRRAQVEFAIDAARVYVTGVSRGGHLAWDLALRHPDRFAAVAPMIGGPRLNPRDGQNNIRYAENVVSLPIRDLQGSHDDPRMLFNLRLLFGRLDEFGAQDAKLIEFDDLGHSFRMEAVDWMEFLGAARRDPLPVRVVRCAARLDEARNSWLRITAFDRRRVEEEFRLRIPAREWDRLDDAARRERVQRAADERTARLVGTLREQGRIVLRGEHVRGVELLLTPEMLDADGRVRVTWRGRVRRRRPEPSAAVLLREFVERVDRGFLPIARLRL